MTTHDEQGRDKKRKALRDPETEKDLGEQSPHDPIALLRVFAEPVRRADSRHREWSLTWSPEWLTASNLCPQPAHMHVEAAIKGMKFAPQDRLRKLLPGHDFSGRAHQGLQ